MEQQNTDLRELSSEMLDAVSGGIVRDHRDQSGQSSNTVGLPCFEGCEGEGGLNLGAQPARNQDHSTGGGTPQVYDHRTGH
jgi:hypothetical protein